MKRIVVVVMLSLTSFFLYSMESIQEINLELLKVIEKQMTISSILMKSKSPDGKIIAILDSNGNIALYDGITGIFMEFLVKSPSGKVVHLGFSNDGTKVTFVTSAGIEKYPIVTLLKQRRVRVY
ncbi:hypothetical protein H0X06_04370 [Candidatus Dependentiae bacterium]|nr:hypothetical protein [Candidatus Dependentiae bacterium]